MSGRSERRAARTQPAVPGRGGETGTGTGGTRTSADDDDVVLVEQRARGRGAEAADEEAERGQGGDGADVAREVGSGHGGTELDRVCGCADCLSLLRPWCPTTRPRKRPCSNGGPSSHSPRSSQNTPPVRPPPSPLPPLTPPKRPRPTSTPSLQSRSRTPSDAPACRYPPPMPTATSTSGATSPSSSQSGPSLSPLSPAHLTPPQRPPSQRKRYVFQHLPPTPLIPRSHRGPGHLPCKRLRQAHARPPGRLRDTPPRA